MYKIISIVCITLQLTNVVIGVKLTRMTQHVDFGPDVKPDSVLISDKSNFANPGLVYGVCNLNSSSSNIFLCKMFMETPKAIGKPEHVRSCNVTVKRQNPGHTVQRSVVALDDDTAVIIPKEYSSTSLTFVRFSDCHSKIVELNYDLSSARVLAPLDNVFDLIRIEGGGGDDDDKCLSDCRAIMDFNGSVILRAHKWLRHYQNEYAAMQSPTRGRLLVSTPSMFLDHVLQISAVDDNGDIVTLKTYPTDYDATNGYKITASTTHQLLSACAAVHLNITCGQFDFMGFLVLQTNVTVTEFTSLHSIKVFNLPEGGIMLLYAECSRNNTENNCQYSQERIFVKKIDFTGKKNETLEITQFKGNNVLERLHFFVSEQNDLCFSQPYLDDGFVDNKQLNLDVVCFENNEFAS